MEGKTGAGSLEVYEGRMDRGVSFPGVLSSEGEKERIDFHDNVRENVRGQINRTGG